MAQHTRKRKKTSRRNKAGGLISLNMIVKDEAEFIEDCLTSVKGVVDEIVVVDTGSSDSTPEIARSLGAQVYSFDWCDDFSAARNEGLAHCTGDWVLTLDADEKLDAETKHFIRKAAANPDADFCYLRLINMSKIGPAGPEIRTLRLLRRLDGLRYHGRIHEQPILRRVKPGFRCDALIRHYGYDPDVFSGKDKKNRNTRLIELGLADTEDGANPKLRSMYLFYHALQAEGEERFQRLDRFALYVRREAVAVRGRLPWIPCGMIHYSVELRNRDRIDDLADTARWTLEHYGAAPVLHALLAHALLRSGQITESETAVKIALTSREASDIHDEYSLPGNLAEMLGHVVEAEIHERRRQWPEAEQCYRSLSPSMPEVGPRYAYVLSRQGKNEQALQVLEFSLAAQQEVRPDQACLAFVLSLAQQSTRGLLAWGEQVRAVAEQNETCRKVLDRVEGWQVGRPFHIEDFPEIDELMEFKTQPPRGPASETREESAAEDEQHAS